MALYLISYDINEKDSWEYDKLWKKLTEIGAKRILYSEWVAIAEVGESAKIYNAVASTIQDKDRLLVQEITKDAVWDKILISDIEFRQLLQSARG